MKISPPRGLLFLVLLLVSCAGTNSLTPVPPTDPVPPTGPPPSPTAAMILIFEDEFDGPALDTSIWSTSYRWGRTNNNEAQYYAEDAFTFIDGFLRIAAEERDMGNRSYTSGLISSHDKFDFTYGYVEMRARLPAGQGFWPAFWMHLDNDNKTGEIDVFELLGHQPTVLHMTLHWPDALGRHTDEGHIFEGPDFSQDFHVFAVDWRPEVVIWYVDGIERARIAHDIPSGPMYLIANLAIGGDWPGFPDETTPFPAYYDIDYIRVYQRP